MNPSPVHGATEVPLTGCDAYFLAIEDLMAVGSQGRNIGLTVLELENALDIGALRDAIRRFSLSHPLLHGKIRRTWAFGAPFWQTPDVLSPDAVPLLIQPADTDSDPHCRSLLQSSGEHFLEIHVIPGSDKTMLVAKWSHLLFDGRGAELALQEIARLALTPSEPSRPVSSWSIPFPAPSGFLKQWKATHAFVERHHEMKPSDFRSLGGPQPRAGAPAFRIVRFSREETSLLLQRAARMTGGIFQMPYFFAAAAKAHAAVFQTRGEKPASYVSPVPVQARKPRARHPIFQNQVTVLHFKLQHTDTDDLEKSTASIHAQFEASVRVGMEASSATVLWWMRRLPTWLYRRFLQNDTCGEIVSFFQSHTGEFMPSVGEICGARITNGWHIPSVAQPPGSGIFFSEREGRLTATISWRDGTLSMEEAVIMELSLRGDLLGA